MSASACSSEDEETVSRRRSRRRRTSYWTEAATGSRTDSTSDAESVISSARSKLSKDESQREWEAHSWGGASGGEREGSPWRQLRQQHLPGSEPQSQVRPVPVLGRGRSCVGKSTPCAPGGGVGTRACCFRVHQGYTKHPTQQHQEGQAERESSAWALLFRARLAECAQASPQHAHLLPPFLIQNASDIRSSSNPKAHQGSTCHCSAAPAPGLCSPRGVPACASLVAEEGFRPGTQWTVLLRDNGPWVETAPRPVPSYAHAPRAPGPFNCPAPAAAPPAPPSMPPAACASGGQPQPLASHCWASRALAPHGARFHMVNAPAFSLPHQHQCQHPPLPHPSPLPVLWDILLASSSQRATAAPLAAPAPAAAAAPAPAAAAAPAPAAAAAPTTMCPCGFPNPELSSFLLKIFQEKLPLEPQDSC